MSDIIKNRLPSADEREEWRKRFDETPPPLVEATKPLADRVFEALPLIGELSGTAKTMVRGVIDRLATLGRLDMSDVCALSILAIEYDKVVRAAAAMVGDDLVTEQGKRNPLLAVASTSEQVVLSLIKEFGLSAKSRKTLNERDTAPRKNDLINQLSFPFDTGENDVNAGHN